MTPLKSPARLIGAGIIALSLGACDRNEVADEPTAGAASVTTLTSPAADGSLAPHLAVTTAGEAVLAWLEPEAAGSHAVKYAVLRRDAWSAPRTIATGDDWFVNWADVPSVVPITAQQWAAHWLVKRTGGTYAYHIAMTISGDGGSSWRAPLTPHTDDTPTEHGFVTMFRWSTDIGAVWLDGRNMPPDPGIADPADDRRPHGGMTLRYARLDDDGAIRDEGEIDNLVCDCCQTDVAVAAAGPIVAYRDRTPDEIRDISISRFVDGNWAAPQTIADDRWQIAACPVNGPAIAADGNRIVVAWYGAPERNPRIKLAWSEDGGRTFSAPQIIDDDRVRGRVDVALLPGGDAAVSWVAKPDDETAQLRLRRATIDGNPGPIEIVAQGRYSRNAGFPQMVRAGDRLVFAWPEPGEPRRVLTAYKAATARR